MVHAELWYRAVPEEFNARGMTIFLCIGCLEARIGRRLIRADFTDCPLNRPSFREPSALGPAERL